MRQNKGGTAKKLVLDDDEQHGFWARVSRHVKVTKPMLGLLRRHCEPPPFFFCRLAPSPSPSLLLCLRHDSCAPTTGKVYHGWYQLGEHIKGADTQEVPYQKEVEEKFDERWAYGHSEFAAAAYVVDPEFRQHDHASNEEVMAGFMDTVEKIGILTEVRRLQEQDQRFSARWQQRKELIAADPKSLAQWTYYPDYPTSDSDHVKTFCVKVNEQLQLYRDGCGAFARSWLLETAQKMPAHHWWAQYGASTPELRNFACLVLSQAGSSSICERINCEFAFIADRKRNRLAHARANKLVSLFHNLRLLKRMNKVNYEEPAVSWTDVDEASGITKYGVVSYE